MAPIRIPSGTYTTNPASSASAGASTAPPSSGWDYILKFILVGDSCVGKSSLLVRLTDDRFLTNPDPTIGVEFGSHLISLPSGETVKVQVWDTAGSESFRSITRSYYRGAAGAVLVYDITHRQSFLNVKGWLDDVRRNAEDKVSVVLVGNMYDLVESGDTSSAMGEQEEAGDGGVGRKRLERRRSKGKRRQVSYEEAKQFAQQEGLLFLEASAKSGYNVKQAFTQAAMDIHSKFSAQASDAAGSQGALGGVVGGKYDGLTLGRSRMRARAGGRTSGTVALHQPSPTATARVGSNASGFSIRSLTGGGSTAPSAEGAEERQQQGKDACCLIA